MTSPTTHHVRVTIVGAEGSTPREVGASMRVSTRGLAAGTVGGGALEFTAIARARAMLDANASEGTRVVETMVLGPDLAQCCGGVVTLAFEVVSVSAAHDVPLPRPLILYGAGHIGRAVVRAVRDLPLVVTWIDDNAARFPDGGESGSVRRVVDDLTRAAEDHPPGALHLVVTYSHAADEAICRNVLCRNDFLWLGLIGSKTKAARFRQRFARDGIASETIARLKSPVGIGGIASKAPPFIALSIAAEIAQVIAGDASPTLSTVAQEVVGENKG